LAVVQWTRQRAEPQPQADKGHRQAHEAVMYRDDLFPACDQCDLKVRFKLIRSAPYIFDDEDFARE
jgi:hypothetical protein